MQHTVFYQWMLRALAQFYDCEPDVEAILARRKALGVRAVTQQVVSAANMRGWLVDYGFLTNQVYAHDELQAIVPCRIAPMLRPSLKEIAAGPSHGSIRQAWYS